MLIKLRTANLDNLIEVACKAVNGTVITLAHMNNFIHNKEEEIPPVILGILKEKEQFIREFMSRYSNWFNQDIGHIMEKELEDVLDEFREIVDFKFELAPKVEALVETRDLLIEIHSLISERESLKECFSVDSLVKMINNPNVPLVSEAMLKTLKSDFEVIQNRAEIVDITYPNHIKMLKDLEGYIWKLDVQTLLSNKYVPPMPNTLYKMYRNCPDMNCEDELKKLGKKLKINPIDTKEVRKGIVDWLNEKNNHQESRRLIDKALITDTRGDEIVEQYVRLANKIMQNDHKLTETTVHQLIEFGFGNTKMVQKYLGKETATKKHTETENLESNGVFREPEVTEENEMIQDVIRSQSNDGFSLRSGTGSCEKKEEQPKASRSLTPNKEEQMNLEEIPESNDEILEKTEMMVENSLPDPLEQTEDHQTMMVEVIDQVPEESIQATLPIEGQEISCEFEILNYEIPSQSLPEDDPLETLPEQQETVHHVETLQEEPVPQPMEEEKVEDMPLKETIIEKPAQQIKLETKPKVEPQSKPRLSLDDANKYYRDGRKPSSFAGSHQDFAECFELAQKMATNSPSSIDLEILGSSLLKIAQSSIQVNGIDRWIILEKKARALKTKVLKMTPEDIVQNIENIKEELNSFKEIRILEVERVLEEVERDRKTYQELNEAMIKRDRLTLEELTILKNRRKAAIYFSDKVLSSKIYDLYIMAVINAWKIHDHDKDKTQLDYITLKELLTVVLADELNPRRFIKPDNADFIKKLYEKVRAYIRDHILSLKVDDMKDINLEMSYKRFIDLTSKMIHHKTKSHIEQKRKKKITEENRLSIALKPTGIRSKINRTIDYEHISGKFYLIKPAFINRIDQEHRKFFLASIKYHLEGNTFMKFGHEGAYIAALGIEKDLFERNLNRALLYEDNGMTLVNFLERLKKLKYISIKIMKTHGSKYDNIMCFSKLSDEKLKEIDASYNKKFHMMIEKRQKREDMIVNRSHSGSIHGTKDEISREPMKTEKLKEGKKTSSNTQKSSKTSKYKLSKNQDIELMQSSLIKHTFDTYRIFEGDFSIGSSLKKTFKNVRKFHSRSCSIPLTVKTTSKKPQLFQKELTCPQI